VSSDPADRALSRLLDNPAVWAEVPTGLKDRVLAEALAAGRDAAPEPIDDAVWNDDDEELPPPFSQAPPPEPQAPAPPPPPAQAPPVRSLDQQRQARAARRGWARPALLAAAVAAVFGIGVVGGTLLAGDESGSPGGGTEVALAGTENLPDASGSVVLNAEPSGFEVVLSVEGLPPAPEGTFYEAWLLGADGKVSAGTFHLREPQDEITLWLGVDIDDYDAISVTRQPIVGGSLADGVVVLKGPLHPQP
jgi:hypothetical protein